MRNCERSHSGVVDEEWTMDIIESPMLGWRVVTPQIYVLLSVDLNTKYSTVS